MYFTADGQIYSIEPGGERRAGVMRSLEGVSLQTLTIVEDLRHPVFVDVGDRRKGSPEVNSDSACGHWSLRLKGRVEYCLDLALVRGEGEWN